MAFYIGIDGGGTKTRCVVGDENRVLAHSTTGACNVVRVGVEQARAELHSAVQKVCDDANVPVEQIKRICIGAAGAAREEVAQQIHAILGELTPASVDVVGDTVIALEAAFGSGPGIIAISGTGSIIYGRNGRGETARAGGWGYAISDEGSAQWIGRRAVWTILRAHDQGLETKLTGLILKAWKLETLDELVQRANAVPPPEFPELFPVVLRAANEGDATAKGLLRDAANQLAEQTSMVIRRLFFKPSVVETQPATTQGNQTLTEHARVAMTGSVFRQSAEIREVFYNRLRRAYPGIEMRSDLIEPVEGALALARKGR